MYSKKRWIGIALATLLVTGCVQKKTDLNEYPEDVTKPKLSQYELDVISEKIYQNETSGKPKNLMFWSPNESFASLGIGHFIWYPKGEPKRFDETFPAMIEYYVANKVPVPKWLPAAGKTGAPIMASKSASAAGSGLVTAVVPRELDYIFESNLIEEMTIPVDSTDGEFGKKAIRQIKEIIKKGKFTSISAGMGMSVNEHTVEIIKEILKAKMPVVIDADGLNNLSIIDNYKDILKKRKYPTVLTPHIGEMARLTGLHTRDIINNMEDVAKEFSKETGVYTVLKGSRTVISTPEGTVFYSIRGNEGMATAGTGDVLSGILGTMVFRLGAEEGVKTGVYIHGLSGDIALRFINAESMRATDLIRFLPDALDMLKSYRHRYSFYSHIDPLKSLLESYPERPE